MSRDTSRGALDRAVLIAINENPGREGRGKVAACDLDGSYVFANGELDQGEEAMAKRSGGETRKSPLVVKRADRNPDTFVGY